MNTTNDQTELGAILGALESIEARLDRMERRQRASHDFVNEMTPIAKEMMGVGGEKLSELERRGYFAFARELGAVVDKIVVAYSEDDVRQLGDNVVRILDTVKNVTQPDILAIANEATDAVHGADEAEPKGVLGMLGSTRDKDVRKGMAVVLQVLRHVGRAAGRVGGQSNGAARRRRLAASLAPRNPAPAAVGSPEPARRQAAPSVPAPAPVPAAAALQIPGFALTPEGFLADPDTWTPEFAEAMAAELGLEMTDAHRALIEFVRTTWADTGTSPNVRKIGSSGPVTTKELYAMFPTAPAIQAARLSGVPKPAGCI